MAIRKAQREAPEKSKEAFSKYCGIVMPISPFQYLSKATDKFPTIEYSASILATMRIATEDAIRDAGLIPQPVWESDSGEVITKNIINNLFNFNYCVCIICGENANVMLEAGIAIAFNKHVVLVTDNYTKCPFDLQAHQYFSYPIEEGYERIQDYQKNITIRLRKMQNKYSSFLSHYGTWRGVDKLPEQEASFGQIAEMLQDIGGRLGRLEETSFNRHSTIIQPEISYDAIKTYEENFQMNIPHILSVILSVIRSVWKGSSLGKEKLSKEEQKRLLLAEKVYKDISRQLSRNIQSYTPDVVKLIMEINSLLEKLNIEQYLDKGSDSSSILQE